MFLRLVLFLGLVGHKLVWEAFKRGQGAPKAKKQVPAEPLARILKLCKIVVLIGLLVQTLFLRVFPIVKDPKRLRFAGVTIYLVGLITAITGRVQLGRNWVDLEDYRVLEQQSLVTNGIFRHIRHPIYAGDWLLILGLELALNSWLVLGTIPLLLFIVRQALTEEALLSQSFTDYEAYRRRSKRFIPFIL